MKDLESYMEAVMSAATGEDAFETFCSIMGRFGYDKITYSLVTDHPSLNLPKKHGLATSYPQDWMARYGEKDYGLIDPVTQRVLTSRVPFYWSQVTNKLHPLSPPFQMMMEAADAGIGSGIGISLRGHGSELVGIGIAKASGIDDQNPTFLSAAYILSTCLHEIFRERITKSNRAAFTQRELDILCWAAEGKTDYEISRILQMTNSTVRYHWNKITHRLDATSRTHAIIKAIIQYIIEPKTIRPSLKSDSLPVV